MSEPKARRAMVRWGARAVVILRKSAIVSDDRALLRLIRGTWEARTLRAQRVHPLAPDAKKIGFGHNDSSS
jgi:hypothetical protein